MTRQEVITEAFYRFELPLRGWKLYPYRVSLEPPFVPFWYYVPEARVVDDGRVSVWNTIKQLLQPPSEEELIEEPVVEELQHRDRELKALRVSLPKDHDCDVFQLVSILSLLSFDKTSISFELIASKQEVSVQFVCEDSVVDGLSMSVRSIYPEIQIEEVSYILPFDLDHDNEIAIVDFGLSDEIMRPLNVKQQAQDSFAQFFTLASSLEQDETLMLQVLIEPTSAPWSYHLKHAVIDNQGRSFFLDEPNMPRLVEDKTNSSLYACVIRIASQGTNQNRSAECAQMLTNSVVSHTKSTSNHLVPLSNEEYPYESHRLNLYSRQSNRTGMILSEEELCNLVHLPSDTLDIFPVSWRFQSSDLPPSLSNNQYVLGEHKGKVVSIDQEQRKRHAHFLGSTGVGKSTILANLILQDITHQHTVILIDPHGDIVDDVLARTPEDRLKDVILIDPSDQDFIVGWNILEARDETEKIIISSDLISAFKKESSSWGDVINSVFSNAIYSFLESPRGGTLIELKRFLIEKDYRDEYVKTIKDEQLKYYWDNEFPLLKKSNIAPLLTRIDTFLRSKVIRNVLAQKDGINISECIEARKVILIKLAQGAIGEENSRILGTLFLSKIYQAILSRQRIPQKKRHFIGFYIDECHNYITRTITQILSGGRKFGVGLHLAHQNFQHLKSEFVKTINENTKIKVFFRLGYNDIDTAKRLFGHFDEDDFQNLGRGEAIVRAGLKKDDVYISTYPLPEPEHELDSAISTTKGAMAGLGQSAQKVEALIKALYYRNEKVSKLEPKTVSQDDILTGTEDTGTPESQSMEESIETHEANVKELKEQLQTRAEQSQHRKLQQIIKKCGQDNGYISVIEAIVEGGKVDVSLTRGKERIAVEISVSNSVEYEVKNITKCINAGYTTVIIVSDDLKQLKKIEKAYTYKKKSQLKFVTSQQAIAYISHHTNNQQEDRFHIVKGFRVKTKYEETKEDESLARSELARILGNKKINDEFKRK
jgi:cyclophilin family peptidyl-prolyl cis-trans isomerase